MDCIVGASKQMHTVIDAQCTGCELCVPVCPVDCIAMVEVTGTRTGWDAWSPQQADEARERYAFHRLRVERERRENDERLAAKAAGQAGRPAGPVADHRPGPAAAQARRHRSRHRTRQGCTRILVMTDEQVERFFATLAAANPQPVSELEFSSVFELLAAVLLSAQATDVSVNKATRALFAVADTPQRMLALGVEGLEPYIRTIGLYRTKARNLIATCQLLIERHGGEVPRSLEALQALPGVGRKTANVVLNVAFGEPTFAVDTHVFRVSNRTGLAPGRNPLEVETGLQRRVPERYRADAHHWLILHGRYVCMARRPLCESCSVAACCDHARDTIGHLQ